MSHADRIDELGRLVIWARSRNTPRPLTADQVHRYALDRTAWLQNTAPTAHCPEPRCSEGLPHHTHADADGRAWCCGPYPYTDPEGDG